MFLMLQELKKRKLLIGPLGEIDQVKRWMAK